MGARGFGNEIRIGNIEQFHFDRQKSIFRIDTQERVRGNFQSAAGHRQAQRVADALVSGHVDALAGLQHDVIGARAGSEGREGHDRPAEPFPAWKEPASLHASPNA